MSICTWCLVHSWLGRFLAWHRVASSCSLCGVFVLNSVQSSNWTTVLRGLPMIHADQGTVVDSVVK